MTKAQALAFMDAAEGAGFEASMNLTFQPPGVEKWTVTIPTDFALDAVKMGELASYCQANGLVLSGTFSYLGVS
jgi:hypothetical protein